MEQILITLDKEAISIALLKKDSNGKVIGSKLLLGYEDAYGNFENEAMIEDIVKLFKRGIGQTTAIDEI